MRPRPLALAAAFAVAALALTGCAADDATGRRGRARSPSTPPTPRARSRAPPLPPGQVEVHGDEHRAARSTSSTSTARTTASSARSRTSRPGSPASFNVDLSEPGTYQTACKPGMVGRRHPGRLHRDRVGRGRADEHRRTLAAAVAEYQAFVAAQSDELLERHHGVRRRWSRPAKVDEAKALYPRRALALGADRAGGRVVRRPRPEDRRPRGGRRRRGCRSPATTASRRTCGSTACSPTPGDRRPAARRRHRARREGEGGASSTRSSSPTASKALLDEMATGKITGEEERYSHTDLWDFDGQLRGLAGRASRRCARSSRAANPTLLGGHRRARHRARRGDRLAQEGRRLRPLHRADPGRRQGAHRGPRRVLGAGRRAWPGRGRPGQ